MFSGSPQHRRFWSLLKLPLRKYPNSFLATICMITSTLILRTYNNSNCLKHRIYIMLSQSFSQIHCFLFFTAHESSSYWIHGDCFILSMLYILEWPSDSTESILRHITTRLPWPVYLHVILIPIVRCNNGKIT